MGYDKKIYCSLFFCSLFTALPSHFTAHRSLLTELTIQQVAFIAIVAIAFLLLITNWLRNDLVAILTIIALAGTGVLSPSEALAGFGSEAAIIVASVFVMSGAFHKTGLSDLMGAAIGRFAGKGYGRVLAVVMISVALLSAFTHHVTMTAVMLPVVLMLCRERRLPASRLLMPLSFAASLGTTITLIGAPAFLVASNVLQHFGRPPLGMFSIAPIGLSLTVAGTLFMLLAGRFLLPVREAVEDLSNLYRLDYYFTELKILPDSSFIGKTMAEVTASDRYHFTTVGMVRDGQGQCRPPGDSKLREGDVLWVHATPEDMIAFQQESGIELHPLERFGLEKDRFDDNEEEPSEQLVQAVVAPTSDIVHRSLQEVDFRGRYGAIVVGLWRRGGYLCQELATIKLAPGDVLVLQGDRQSLSRVSNDPAFLLMTPFHGEARLRRKARVAGAIMLATVAAAALNLLSLEIIMLAGAAAMVLLGCIRPRQAYRAVDTRIYVFIAGAVVLGAAMEKTGTAVLLAGWLQQNIGGWSPTAVLLFIFAIVAVVTQFLSDAATTALFAPIAAAFAQTLGQAPEPYVITVAMAAVTSFLTPIGHHGNLLVYGPGRYEFTDFTKVGAPLTVIIALIVVLEALAIWAK